MARPRKQRPAAPDGDHTKPILELVREVVPNADDWLAIPNSLFCGEPPRTFIGDPRKEEYLRQIVLAAKYGIYS